MEVTKVQQWVILTVLLLVVISNGFAGVLLVLDVTTSGRPGADLVSMIPLLALDMATSLVAILMGTLLFMRPKETAIGGSGDIEELIKRVAREVVTEELRELERTKGSTLRSAPETEPSPAKPLGEELSLLKHRETQSEEPKVKISRPFKVLTGKEVSLDESDAAVRQAMKASEKLNKISKSTKEGKKEEKEDKGSPEGR